MIILLAFAHGMALALTLILPLGPQNLFVFSQGVLQPKFRLALPSVLAASTSDTTLIVVTILCLSAITSIVDPYRPFLLLAAAVFLFVMAIATWKTAGKSEEAKPLQALAPGKQMALAFGCSLNPHAFADILGTIGPTSLEYPGIDRFAFATGCIFLSWGWFFGLAYAGRQVGARDSEGRFRERLAQVSAVLMLVFALFLLFSAGRSIFGGN